MKYLKYYTCSMFAVFLSSTTAVNGQLLFSDNFEAWTAGQPTTDSGVDPTRWKSDGDPFDIIEVDTGNVFGGGTSNQFLRVGNQPDGSGTSLAGGSLDIEQRNYDKGIGVPTGVLRVSFDLYEPSNGNGNGFTSDLGEALFLRLRGDKSGSELHTIRIDDGQLRATSDGSVLHTFGEDTVVRFDFIYNQSGADISFRGSALDAGSYSVYADGGLVVDNLTSGNTTAPSDDVERILLRTEYAAGGPSAQEVWIDNWETAAVPEPSMIALWAGSLMLGLAFSRRQRSAR